MKISKQFSRDYIASNQQKIQELAQIAVQAGGRCIYSKGVFDLVHSGHLSLFAFLAELKSKMELPIVIGIASDRLTKEKKGDKRPINSEGERMRLISLLPQVDYVHLHDEMGYEHVIETLKPVVYVKGMDTGSPEMENESAYVDKNPELIYLDADAEFILFCDDGLVSTSEVIAKILATV